jgi:hypothetical protein
MQRSLKNSALALVVCFGLGGAAGVQAQSLGADFAADC